MRTFSFSFGEVVAGELPGRIVQLIESALGAAHGAYAPYSRFKVGAAVLLENGVILTGANHENAAFPAGICAERAVLAAVNPTDKQKRIEAIAVAGLTGRPDTPLTPCGICRQNIIEQQTAQGHPIAVYMCSTGKKVIFVDDARYLLPFHFSSKDFAGNL